MAPRTRCVAPPARLLRGPYLLVAVLLVATLAAPARADTGPAYDWPVPAEPVVAFDAPGAPWAAGHRGVDLPVAAGQPVHPMAPGRVVHAGPVAGTTWVTVQHADGIRTSYGPLQPLSHAGLGDRVDPTAALGAAAGQAHGTPGRLHVGARRGDRYVDPAGLVAIDPGLVASLVGPGTAQVPRQDRPRRATLVPGAGPSPNRLVVLSGLTSHTGEVPFDLAGLGYGPGTWQQYSYRGLDEAGEPAGYRPDATWGRVHDMAEALRAQLRQHADDHPGQAVDLVGHSLGGLVAMYYLLVLHDATDPTLPPIGRVATVAAPLQGADSADAVARVRDSPLGRALLELVATQLPTDPVTGEAVVHPDVPVLEDLRPGAPATRAVRAAWERYRADPWASPLATGTEVLTVGSMLDPVVNAHRSGLPGADHETVLDPDPVHAHGDATTDARVVEALGAFLARDPVPDGGLAAHAVDLAAEPAARLLATVERLLARGVAVVDDATSPPGLPAPTW